MTIRGMINFVSSTLIARRHCQIGHMIRKYIDSIVFIF